MAPKVYDVLLTFDIQSEGGDKHSSEIRIFLIEYGYCDRYVDVRDSNKIKFLPESTLWKRDINVEQAYIDLQAVVNVVNSIYTESHRIANFIAVPWPNATWHAPFKGTPHNSASLSPEKH